MGTRGAIGVRINGEDKVTYNHFDSYPSGIGLDVLYDTHLLLKNQKDLVEKAAKLTPVEEEDVPTSEQVEALKKYADLKVGDQNIQSWYCLLRETQGDIGAMLDAMFYIDSVNFLLDSLFCEWAYIVNLDENVYEIYQGFVKEPHTQGRYGEKHIDRSHRTEKETIYYPVKLVLAIPLSIVAEDIDEAMELLLALECYERDEDESDEEYAERLADHKDHVPAYKERVIKAAAERRAS